MPQPSPSPFLARVVGMREPLWLPIVILAILLAVLPVTLVAMLVAQQQATAASARYGSTIAERLAASAVDPLLADDLITLSLVVREFKALADVATVAIYGADDRLLAAADGLQVSPARRERDVPAGVHVEAIRIEDTIAGFARVAVVPSGLAAGPPWLFVTALGAMLALAAAGAWLGRRLDARLELVREELEEFGGHSMHSRGHLAALLELSASLAAEQAAPPVADPRQRQLYVLVVNLFNQISLPTDARSAVLARCETALEQVCRLYGGRQETLPRTGILVTLDALADSGDHAFHAICAALLAQRVFADLNRQRVHDGEVRLLLRIGLEQVLPEEGDVNADVGMARAFPDSVARGITLSALARDEGIAVGDLVIRACSDPDRLQKEPLQSAALRALGGSGHAWLVFDLAPGYRGLLERQAQLLLGGNA